MVTRPKWIRRTKQVAVFLLIVLVVCFGAVGALYAPIYREAVQNVQYINGKLIVPEAKPSVIVSADGKILYSIALMRRTPIEVDTLPAYVRYAMVAAEDRRFYDHKGVDVIGLLRSAFTAVRDRHAGQGGSTIDMQLAKKLVNGDEHSMTRKLKDIATAQQIENLKTKGQILNLYMNAVYFGEGAYGIEAAAQTYFGKPAKDLTLAEAAMLSRCVRSPSRQNPIRDLQGSMARRDYVLQVMYEEHWITGDQYNAALKEVPKLNPDPPQGIRTLAPGAGYFVDHVLQQFHADFPNVELKSGGYRIETALNYRLQKAAVSAVSKTVNENRKSRRVTDAAFMMMDSDGRILAEVGGPSYSRSQWNTITQGHRQPGSAFKPILYTAALKEGVVHPGQEISNEAIVERDEATGKVWRPRNNGIEHIGGTMDLTHAFARSFNLPAIHTIQAVTPDTVVKYAHDVFGFHSHLPPYDSLAIGTGEVSPLEMAEAYSVFMNRGDRVSPFPIARVMGPDGSILKEYQPNRITGVLDQIVCQEMDDMMDAVVQWGTGMAAKGVPNARGKTGTTQDAKDAWFCGYSDGLLGVGWVGNTVWRHHKPYALPMGSSVYGGTITAGMWAEIMGAAHRLNLAKPLPPPATIANQNNESDGTVVAKADTGKPNQTPAEPDPKLPPDSGQNPPYPDSVPPIDPAQGDRVQPKTDPPPSTPPPPKATQASVKKDDEADYVEVMVCADTGMRASQYCPETVTKRFKRGTEPKQVCRLHTGG